MNGKEKAACVYVSNRLGRIDWGLSKLRKMSKTMRVSVRVNVVCANLIVFLAYQNYYRYYTFSLRYFVNVVPFINFTLCSRFVQLCAYTLLLCIACECAEWNGSCLGIAMSIHKSRDRS